MATTEKFYTGNTSTTTFGFPFPILQNSDLKVELDGVLKTENTSGTNNDYSIVNTDVVFNSAPGQDVDIHIYRLTDVDSPKAVFAAGSSIRAGDLNNIVDQSLYANQEQQQKIRTADVRDDAVTTIKIKDLNVTRPKIADDAIDGTKIADDSINSEHYVADSIDTEHYAPGSVDNTALGADCVTGAKIADDQINSEHYVAGSIDLEHMSANSVDSAQLVNGSVDLIHMSANSVDSDQYVDGSIDLIHMSANSVDSDQYVDGSIDRVHLEADIIDSTKLADNAVNSEHYVDGSIDREHLAADIVDSTKIADDAIGAEHIQANAVTDSEIATGTLDNRYYTETELNAGQLDNRYYTEAELNAGQLDNRYYTETEAEAKFLRQDSSETIASGTAWSNSDAFVATTAAINARIIDLIDEVGGFTAIANETSFPATNPQGATGQAAILSIQAASTTLTPQSGTTLTIANGAGSGNTVTITGVPTAIPQNFGFLVESTSTTHTYSFHRLVPIATQINTVAQNITNIVNAGANVADINNFADLYIISGSEPTQRNDGTNLQEGDLWYDSSNDNLQVYTGSAFSIITPSQSVLDDVAIVSGAITYSEDLGLITDAASTGSSNGSLDIVADALEDEITFTVTAATGKFIIDGVDKPALTLYKGWTYTFDVSDASNANHPLRFQSGGSAYNTGVTVTGTQGQAGAKVQLVVPESQPTSFQYYCTNHSGMGNTITVKDDPIKTVSDNVTTILAVANNSTNVNAVAGNATNINAVAGNATNINAVQSNASNINAVAGNATNINAVAADAADIGAVAGKATEIGRLGTADAVADMNTLGTTAIVSDMDTLADISSNITTVAGISSNVTTVAGISANVTTVANNNSNVTAVAGNATNINTNANNAANINTVAGSISNVNTTAGSINNVNTVAGSIADVNTFANRYRIGSTNPTTSLDTGDLFFNTSANELRVYNGSSWQGGVTATGNFATTSGVIFTGDNKYNDNVKAKYGNDSDLQIFHNTTDSIINASGTGNIKLQDSGNTKLEITSTGITTTGNIAVTGTVDGRDVATDGSKLDGIEAGATGDQTASEIVALVAGQTIAPNVITTTNLTLDFGTL